jgi:hypothetical protein
MWNFHLIHSINSMYRGFSAYTRARNDFYSSHATKPTHTISSGYFLHDLSKSIPRTVAPDPDHLIKYGRRSRGFFAAASGLIHLQPELAISGDEIIYRTDNRDGSLLHQATRQTLFGISLMTNNIFRLVIDASLALSSLTSSPAIICSPCAVSVS